MVQHRRFNLSNKDQRFPWAPININNKKFNFFLSLFWSHCWSFFDRTDLFQSVCIFLKKNHLPDKSDANRKVKIWCVWRCLKWKRNCELERADDRNINFASKIYQNTSSSCLSIKFKLVILFVAELTLYNVEAPYKLITPYCWIWSHSFSSDANFKESLRVDGDGEGSRSNLLSVLRSVGVHNHRRTLIITSISHSRSYGSENVSVSMSL